MIKNVNLLKECEKEFLSQKRERKDESTKKILNIEEINKQSPINNENEKINYEKYTKLVEDFYIDKFGISIIQENCSICHMNGFLSNQLLYFQNHKYLFYYLKYRFRFCLNKNKNKLFEDNITFLENQKELNNLNKYNFISKIKFLTPKTICKECFLKLINTKNIIQNIKNIFIDNKIISFMNNINNDFSNELKSVNYIEIKDDKLINENIKFKKENINNIQEEKINKKLILNNNVINNNFMNENKNCIIYNNANSNILNNRNNDFFVNYNFLNNVNYLNCNIINKNKKSNNIINENNNNNMINNIINNIYNNNKYNITINDNNYKKNFKINKNNNINNRFAIQSIRENICINKNNNNQINNDNNNIKNNINKFNQKDENKKEFLSVLDSKNKNEDIKIGLNCDKNKNINLKEYQKEKITNNEKEINLIKHLFSYQLPELLLCLSELKDKLSDIIILSQQLKNQYDYVINNYPNLLDIIISLKKSSFLLHFVATSEIVNNLALSHHYIFQRINIISDIINHFEKSPNLHSKEINEIKNLKTSIQNVYLLAQKKNKEFRESMEKFLDILKTFLLFKNQKENNK